MASVGGCFGTWAATTLGSRSQAITLLCRRLEAFSTNRRNGVQYDPTNVPFAGSVQGTLDVPNGIQDTI